MSSSSNRQRVFRLVGALTVAAIIAAVIIIATSGGDSKDEATPKTAPSRGAPQLLAGIPERGLTLGKASAPVTLVEFNDMQCPICRDYTTAVFPTLVRDYVRTGKLRMEMRLQSFIGPDSEKAGKAVAAAAAQDKAWWFSHAFYNHQGAENTGYVTDDFLRMIAKATPGLDAARLLQDIESPAAAKALKDGTAAFDAAHFEGTPSFLVGKTGGKLSVLSWSDLTPDQFTGPIDRLLGT